MRSGAGTKTWSSPTGRSEASQIKGPVYRGEMWDSIEVIFAPILPVYHWAETRLYLIKGKLGLNDVGATAGSFENETLGSIVVESSNGLVPWPSLEELNASYRKNSLLSTEQRDFDTMTYRIVVAKLVKTLPRPGPKETLLSGL